MGFMIAAYLIIWLAAFVFILSMVRRQQQLQREVAALKEVLSHKLPGDGVPK